MEQKSTSIWKSALMSGLYLAIILILVSVVLYVTGKTFSTLAQYVSYPVLIIGVILAQLAYRKVLGGEMSYGQALGVGVLTVVFASLISGIYTFVMYKYIDPSLLEQMRLFTEQKIIEKGTPEDQIEMAVDIAAKFQKPVIMFAMAIFGGAFMGLIISLITSIFTKKNPSDEIPE